MQEYLSKLNPSDSKEVLRFRVRMAHFSENYKGRGVPELCPLCKGHADSQELSFKCASVLDKININEENESIFEPEKNEKLPLIRARVCTNFLPQMLLGAASKIYC